MPFLVVLCTDELPASRTAPFRQLLLDPTLPLPLEPPPCPPRHDADGPSTHQRPHQDRQGR